MGSFYSGRVGWRLNINYRGRVISVVASLLISDLFSSTVYIPVVVKTARVGGKQNYRFILVFLPCSYESQRLLISAVGGEVNYGLEVSHSYCKTYRTCTVVI
jgi:hypothetical protein